MRRIVRPSSLVTAAIMLTVAAVVFVANRRESRRPRRHVSSHVRRADALLRPARVRGRAGRAREGEDVLRRVLAADPDNYDAKRELGAVYLSQHRFREAIAIA